MKVNKNITTKGMVELLRNCPDNTEIVFESGTYYFDAIGAKAEYLCPVCNKSSTKYIIFPIFNKKNITIDGHGSKFVFTDRVFPFAILNCENVTLKNFSITFSFMRYCVAEAKCRDDGISLAIDNGKYDYDVNQNGNIIFSTGSTEINTAEKYFFLQQNSSVCYLGAGKRFYEPTELAASYMETYAVKTDEGIVLKYLPENTVKPFTDGKLVVSYDEDRSNDNIYFEKCKNVSVKNVTLYRGAGMGIVSQLCENVELDGIVYKAGEDGDEEYSTTADGLFFTNCTGKVRIHHCNICNTMDDTISIHNIYAKVEKILAKNKFIVRYMHKSHSGYNQFFDKDILTVSDAGSLNEIGSCTVKASVIENDTYCVIIDTYEDITDFLHIGDIIENAERCPEVLIDNNVFVNFPHLRLASKNSIKVFMNTFVNGIGIMINDLMKYWYAYGTSKDVLIRGNTFTDIKTCVDIVVERNENSTVRHKNIRIDNNLCNSCYRFISAKNTENLRLSSNYGRCQVGNIIEDVGNVDSHGMNQLLMRRDSSDYTPTPLPKGYKKFRFHRGGDERMTMQEYIDGWFEVSPNWSRDEFDSFYNDDRIPDDGYLLILDENNNIVGHSNVQLNEHKDSTATVHNVAVKESCRGKKLGYIASEMVIEYADEHKIKTIYLTTDEFRVPAIKIYLKLGFKPVVYENELTERWFPILKELGYNQYYRDDNELVTI